MDAGLALWRHAVEALDEIREALDQTDWNVSGAARLLGTERTSLHKRLSNGLQFELNYTFAHSIDNTSATANNIFGTSNFAGGLICDVTNLRVCRGNSDFDVTHVVSATGIWELPVGRGRHRRARPSTLRCALSGFRAV